MVSFESIKNQLNNAKLYTMSGAVIGFMAFPLIDTLDGNAMTLKSAGLGALVGAAVGTGAGMLINAARDNRIDFITIATTGNSLDYGDLTDSRSQIPCATNGHGGLS